MIWSNIGNQTTAHVRTFYYSANCARYSEWGVDALVVNMVDAAAAQGVVDKAKDAGIPVVFFNREPAADVLKSYDKAIFIGTNAADAGIMQGELIAKIWGDGSAYDLNKDGVIQYRRQIGRASCRERV